MAHLRCLRVWPASAAIVQVGLLLLVTACGTHAGQPRIGRKEADRIRNYVASMRQTPTTSVTGPEGQVIDCVKTENQLSIKELARHGHKLQHAPTTRLASLDAPPAEDSFPAGLLPWAGCPEGSVPIPRVTEAAVRRAGSLRNYLHKYRGQEDGAGPTDFGERFGNRSSLHRARGLQASPDGYHHEYSIAELYSSSAKYYGTGSTLSVWSPLVERASEFSLSQLWIVSSSSNTETIEVGWQKYPNKYRDQRPHLFIYWTRDTYRSTGCYNLDCRGFVQLHRSIYPGMALAASSKTNVVDLPLQVFKDDKQNVWWLRVNGQYVGYWPFSIFSKLQTYANVLQWGGEIINEVPNGRHTKTAMGSGLFASPKAKTSAYHKNLYYIPPNLVSTSLGPLKNRVSRAGCYNWAARTTSNEGSAFSFGGPGYSPKKCPGPYYNL